MFTHTLYLSISTQSRYLFRHKRPFYLSTVYTHSPNPSLSLFLSFSLSLSFSLYTRLLLLHSTHSLYHCTHSFSLPLYTLALSICTHTHTLPVCLSTTFHVLQFSIGVFLFVVYSVNNINFSGGLDALGINSVCPALYY